MPGHVQAAAKSSSSCPGEGGGDAAAHLFFVMNLGASSLVVFFFGSYYAFSAANERERAEGLEEDLAGERAKQLGPYTLVSKIGQGGMGVVYRAKHKLLRRPTAIKLLSTGDASARDLVRFEREVQLTSELSHPNIVPVYDYGLSASGEFYYAMEYLPGLDLESLVARYGPLPPSRAVPILIQVCEALDDAHHRGLIHRDIKPGNIILSRVGKRMDLAKVVDFGLVKDIESTVDLTAEHHLAGTPAYLAPEAMLSPDEVGPAIDLYALGAVAFFLVTGERVFTGKSTAEVCAHHIHTEPRAPSSVSSGEIPEALDEVILRCLAKRPEQRYGSAAELREALERVPLANHWRHGHGLEWWNEFDVERESSSDGDPMSGPRLVTVDLRAR